MSLSSLGLDAFLACVRTGNFTQAAKTLNLTQSALSQRVAKLEDELETTLIIRSRSGIQVTPAGEEILRYCLTKEGLERESLERITTDNQKELAGVLRLGGFSSVMRSAILPSLAPLLRQNPKIQLTFLSREMHELPKLLRSTEVDFLVTYDQIVRDDHETQLIGNEKNVLVEKKGYQGPEIYLDHDENDEVTSKYLRLIGREGFYDRRFLDNVYGLIDGVKNGIGRAVIPYHLIKNDRQLKIRNPAKVLKIPVYLHYIRQPYYTRLHQEAVKALTQAGTHLA